MKINLNWWLFKKWWFLIIFIVGFFGIFSNIKGAASIVVLALLNIAWIALLLFLPNKKASSENQTENNNPSNETSVTPQKDEPIYPQVPYGYHRTYYYENVVINANINLDIVKLAEYLDIEDNEASLGLFFQGQLAGNFPENKLRDMVYDYRKKEGKVLARISKVNDDSFEIALGYYLENGYEYKQLLDKKNSEYKTYTLSGNSNNAMQEVVECLSKGDELELEFDYDKDKYCVYSFDCAGYLPKSANNFINDNSDYNVYVNDVFDKNNGKCGVKVDVFLV